MRDALLSDPFAPTTRPTVKVLWSRAPKQQIGDRKVCHVRRPSLLSRDLLVRPRDPDVPWATLYYDQWIGYPPPLFPRLSPV